MEITGQLPPQLKPGTLQPTTSSWRIGQVLQAVVLQQITSATAILQINNQRVQADTTIPLLTGQQFEAEVSQLGQKPVLTVRNVLPAETPVNAAIRQSLPLQTSMSALLTNIAWLSNQQTSLASLSPPLQDLIKQLFNKLPNSEQLNNGNLLKQAIKDSGVFFENKLSQATQQSSSTLISSDLKGLLLKLLDTIKQDSGSNKTSTSNTQETTNAKPVAAATTIDAKLIGSKLLEPLSNRPGLANAQTQAKSATIAAQPAPSSITAPISVALPLPPRRGATPQPQSAHAATLLNLQNVQLILNELAKQTEGAVARTQLHQLASIPVTEQSLVQISFELPIRRQDQVDLFNFSIEENEAHQSAQENKTKSWCVTVAFDLEPLGPMHARLKLENEKIETTFWAENQHTSLLINKHLAELGLRYQKSGIEAGSLQCFHGRPAEPVNISIPQIILDVKA